MSLQEMIDAHPRPTTVHRDTLVRCVDECFRCAATCASCADGCLGESTVRELVVCIRLCLDCADVCYATGRMLARQTAPDPAVQQSMLIACVEACRVCDEECGRHAQHHVHCDVCAEACRRCAQACNEALANFALAG